MKRLLYQIILLTTLLPAALLAGWSEPIAITNNFGSLNCRTVVVGETLHAITSCNAIIGYVRSNNNGDTWTEPTILPDTSAQGEMPDIIAENGRLHVVYIAWGEYFLQSYHISSTDGGRSWSQPHQIFHNWDSALFKYPRLTSKGDTLFFCCFRQPYLMFFRSFDHGVTWRDSTVVESGSIFMDHPPYLLYSQGRLHLVYQLGIVGSPYTIEIYYRQSDDYGHTWTERQGLSTLEPSPYCVASQGPTAHVDSNDNLIVAWFDYKYGSFCGTSGEILTRVSTNNGDSWLPEGRITFTQSGNAPSCLILNDALYAVWMDYWPLGCSYSKMMYSESHDWGTSWSQPELISGDSVMNELSPILFYSIDNRDTIFHCIMSGYLQQTGSDIYYFFNRHTISIDDDLQAKIPQNLSITAYPNPFNSMTKITFSDNKGGEIEIYDISGRLIKSLPVKDKSEGSVIWDAKDGLGQPLASGIYIAKAKTSRGVCTAKLVHLK